MFLLKNNPFETYQRKNGSQKELRSFTEERTRYVLGLIQPN
jgi:hypothetical protein